MLYPEPPKGHFHDVLYEVFLQEDIWTPLEIPNQELVKVLDKVGVVREVLEALKKLRSLLYDL